jgi:hypothetical protein
VHQNKYQLHIAEADTYISAWSLDAVVGISQRAALADISYVIAERLIGQAQEAVGDIPFCLGAELVSLRRV